VNDPIETAPDAAPSETLSRHGIETRRATPPPGTPVTYAHFSRWSNTMRAGWDRYRDTAIVQVGTEFRFKTARGAVKVNWARKTSSTARFRSAHIRVWDEWLWAVQFHVQPPGDEVFGPVADAGPMPKTQAEAGLPAEAAMPVDSDPAHLRIVNEFERSGGIYRGGLSTRFPKRYEKAKVTRETAERLMLQSVCNSIEPRPRKKLGDDPFPSQWLLYAIIEWALRGKGQSYRDLAAHMDELCALGVVPVAPSKPTLHRFFGSPDTTMLLQSVLYALGLPMRRAKPNSPYAFDGTGAGDVPQADYRLEHRDKKAEARAVRWYHPVIAFDTDMKYIVAATLTDSKVGEITKARELLKSMIGFFDMKWILGDGTFSDAEFAAMVTNAGGYLFSGWDEGYRNAVNPDRRGLFKPHALNVMNALFRMFDDDRALYKRVADKRSGVEGGFSAMKRLMNGCLITSSHGFAPMNQYLAYCCAYNIWSLYRASMTVGLDISMFGSQFEDDEDSDGWAA
jgi:DDE family transposase